MYENIFTGKIDNDIAVSKILTIPTKDSLTFVLRNPEPDIKVLFYLVFFSSTPDKDGCGCNCGCGNSMPVKPYNPSIPLNKQPLVKDGRQVELNVDNMYTVINAPRGMKILAEMTGVDVNNTMSQVVYDTTTDNLGDFMYRGKIWAISQTMLS